MRQRVDCHAGAVGQTGARPPLAVGFGHAAFPLGDYSVRRVGFGAMQLPGPGVFGPPRDRDQALAVLRRAVELGVDHIDTAQYYGPDVANDLIREALHPYPDDLALVSKVGARRDDQGGWLPATEPESCVPASRTTCARSASTGWPRSTCASWTAAAGDRPFDEQLDAMIAARDEGLIAGIGLSNVSLEQLDALSATEIVCVQNPLNLVDRSSLPVLASAGPGSPSCRSSRSVRASAGRTGCSATRPYCGAAELGLTPAQVALAWPLAVRAQRAADPGHLVGRAPRREHRGAGTSSSPTTS